MTAPNYRLWHAELKSPTPPEKRLERSSQVGDMCGRWRIESARTKPGYPLAIWSLPEDPDRVLFKVGAGAMDGMSTFDSIAYPDRVQDFIASVWPHCIAVTNDDYEAAMKTGYWPGDNKPARKLTDEERLGLERQDSNNPPTEESLKDQITTLAEIMGALKVTDQDSANKAQGYLDRMRKLLQLAEAARVTEKAPVLQAAKDIDTRWADVSAPGATASDKLDAAKRKWMRDEQKRRDDEAAAETARRAEEAAKASAAMQQTAEQMGMEAPEPVEVEEVVPEQVKVGSAYGRGQTLKMKMTAVVTDPRLLCSHFLPDNKAEWDEGLIEYLTKRANQAKRGNVKLPGVEFEPEKE